MQIRLKVIPRADPKTMSVLRADKAGNDFVFVQGPSGDIEMVCGKCGRVLTRGVHTSQLQGRIVFVCPSCGSANEIVHG